MPRKQLGKEKMGTTDSTEDLIPKKPEEVHLDKGAPKAETGQSKATHGGMRNRRKRAPEEEQEDESEDGSTVPSAPKKRKKGKKGKKPRLDDEPNSDTALDHDHGESDTAVTTSSSGINGRNNKEMDCDSASEKDESNEEEPMDVTEEGTTDLDHTFGETSLPTSMLKPEGSKTQRGYSTNNRPLKSNIPGQHGRKTPTKLNRVAYGETDTVPLKLVGDIPNPGREIRYLSSSPHSSKVFSSRTTIKKSSTAKEPYRDFDPKIHQRHSKQHVSGRSKLHDDMTFSPQGNRNLKTNKVYSSSSYKKQYREDRTASPNARSAAPSFRSFTKMCVYLVVLLAFGVALITFILKMDLITDTKSWISSGSESWISSGSESWLSPKFDSWLSSGCVKRKRSDRFEVLMQEQDRLRQQYPTLNESIFNIIAGASFDHIEEHRDLVRPVVLLLVGKPGGTPNVNNVAFSVANMYANVFSLQRHERDVVSIIGADLERTSPDEARKELHSHIEEGFKKDCANVVLITDLDRVPPCAAILFHAYCDNDGAPYKDAVFIFTMVLTTELAGEAQAIDVEKIVQAQLDGKWSNCPEEFSSAKLVAMHSRVANNIVLI